MKRFEIIFGILSVVAIIMKLALVSGSGILMTLILTLLACFYFYLGFAFFNNIRLKKIFSKSSYYGISALRIIGSIGVGWGLSIMCCGILFKMMHWPGGILFLHIGLIQIFVIAIIVLVKFSLSKSDFYKTILLRFAIIGGLGLLFFFTTDLGLSIARIQYKNHPAYIKAYEKYLENTESDEAYHTWNIEHIRATSKSQEEFEYRKEMYEKEISM